MFLDYPVGDRQPQSVPVRPGREERVEQFLDVLRRYPRSGIRDFKQDASAFFDAGNLKLAAAGHGVDRVKHQVHERLGQLFRVAGNGQTGGQPGGNGDPPFGTFSLHQSQEIFENLVRADLRHHQLLRPAELEERLDDPVDPVELARYDLGIFYDEFPVVEVFREDLGHSFYGSERVFDLMGEPGRHRPDRRQFLRLQQTVIELAVLRRQVVDHFLIIIATLEENAIDPALHLFSQGVEEHDRAEDDDQRRQHRRPAGHRLKNFFESEDHQRVGGGEEHRQHRIDQPAADDHPDVEQLVPEHGVHDDQDVERDEIVRQRREIYIESGKERRQPAAEPEQGGRDDVKDLVAPVSVGLPRGHRQFIQTGGDTNDKKEREQIIGRAGGRIITETEPAGDARDKKRRAIERQQQNRKSETDSRRRPVFFFQESFHENKVEGRNEDRTRQVHARPEKDRTDVGDDLPRRLPETPDRHRQRTERQRIAGRFVFYLEKDKDRQKDARASRYE